MSLFLQLEDGHDLLHQVSRLLQDTNTTDSDSGSNTEDENGSKRSGFYYLLWFGVILLIGYGLYKACRFFKRRHRLLRSEIAMHHLGDLQMLPSQDMSHSDIGYEDDEDEEPENEML